MSFKRRQDRQINMLLSNIRKKPITISRAQRIKHREAKRIEDKQLQIKKQKKEREFRARKRAHKKSFINKITIKPSMEIIFAPKDLSIPQDNLVEEVKQQIISLRNSGESLQASATKSFTFIEKRAINNIKKNSIKVSTKIKNKYNITSNIKYIDTTVLTSIKDLIIEQQRNGIFICKDDLPETLIIEQLHPPNEAIAIFFNNMILGILVYLESDVIKIPLLCVNRNKLLKRTPLGRILLDILQNKTNKTMKLDSVKSAKNFYLSNGFTIDTKQDKGVLTAMTNFNLD